MKNSVFNDKGKEVSQVELPESIWGLPWNADLVHQVVTSMQSNARTGLAHTKGRSEVSGGGKKPWQQKGLGRARHGSSRSPIWIGGGVTHGPLSEKNYSKKINKKMRAKALFTALSQKLRDTQVLFVQPFELKGIKTKEVATMLENLTQVAGFETLTTNKQNNILFVSPVRNATLTKSFRNIPFVTFEETKNLNPVEVMNYRYVVVADPEASNQILAAKLK